VIGLGVDMVQISQLRKQLEDPASVFSEKTFTAGELRYAKEHSSGNPVQHLAARFAAKEALIKAWSSMRIGRPPVIANSNLLEIEVCNDYFGRPQIKLHGAFHQHLQAFQVQISLSHEGDYAIATVLLQES
jgi:holo-[acyl-carrier protein] synthase